VTQPFATGLVHFAIVTQSFFEFCQTFLKFRPSATVTRSFCYNASVILRFHQLFFCDFVSHFEISSRVTVIQLFSDFVMLRCSDSAILWDVSHSWDMISHFIDFIRHFQDFTQSFLRFAQLFVSFFNLQPNPYPTCVEQSVKLHLRIASETLLGSSWWTEVPWSCWREGSNRWKGLDCSGKLISSQYRPSINLNSD
jgi:hypothetical protein